ALGIVEPAQIIDRAVRNELRGEEIPVGILIAAPALADESAAQFQGLPLLFRIFAMQEAARKSAVDDQMGQALGMAMRIADGDGAALRQADQGKSLEARAVDHRLEVLDKAIERDARHVAL